MRTSNSRFFDYLIRKSPYQACLTRKYHLTRKFEKLSPGKHIININTKTVRELRSIAKDKGLHGYYILKKDYLVPLLLEQSTKEMPSPPPRVSSKERRPVFPVNIISSPQEMDEFEKEDITKGWPVVKNRLNKWHDWLVDHVPKSIKNTVGKAFLRT